MALNIKIDVNDCYPVRTLANSYLLSKFESQLKNGTLIPMGISISDKMHPIIPNVYNLAFGPIDEYNQIDDKAKLSHLNHSKLFSTIVLTGLSFLKDNEKKFLGIDGSCNARAYMYYRCIQNNFDYLNQFMNIYGVYYYVRVFRNSDDRHPFDKEDILAMPHPITKEANLKYAKLYNYFIFNSKQTKHY